MNDNMLEPNQLSYQQRKIMAFLLLVRKFEEIDYFLTDDGNKFVTRDGNTFGFAPLKEDTRYIYTVDSNGDITLVRYLGDSVNVITPTMISGHPVKYIAPTCYSYLSDIETLTISPGITTVY